MVNGPGPDERLTALIERLEKLDNGMKPAPWNVGAMHEAIRHIRRNTDVMEDALEYSDDKTGNLPDRYDGEPLAELRNLLPEIIAALKGKG